MNVFFVSALPQHSAFFQKVTQVAVATFARAGYTVTSSTLASSVRQVSETRGSHPPVLSIETSQILSDRYNLLSAQKLIFQLTGQGTYAIQPLEGWLQQVFSESFIHNYGAMLAGKQILAVFTEEAADYSLAAASMARKALLEGLLSRYLKAADIKVALTPIPAKNKASSAMAQKNFLQEYSKKMQFYALLLSSSIRKAG